LGPASVLPLLDGILHPKCQKLLISEKNIKRQKVIYLVTLEKI
jgi:hypothetical protein